MIPWSGKWQPILVFLPGKSHGQRSLAGYSPWGSRELDTTEHACTRSTEGPDFYFFLPALKWLGHSLFYICLQYYHMKMYHLCSQGPSPNPAVEPTIPSASPSLSYLKQAHCLPSLNDFTIFDQESNKGKKLRKNNSKTIIFVYDPVIPRF